MHPGKTQDDAQDNAQDNEQDNADQDLLIGAIGWNHAAWDNNFYPDDMPEDWRLPYYANEFQTVLVPETDWISVEQDDVEGWLDETDDDFVFFFGLTLASLNPEEKRTSLGQILSSLDAHPERVGGLVITVSPGQNLDKLHTFRQDFALTLPINIDVSRMGNDTPDIKAIIAQQDVDICWHNSASQGGYKPARHCNIGLIDTSTALSNKDLREQIDKFNSIISPQCPSALFLGGDPPNISNLRDIRMIKELIMG